jgi:hypothetical protein
MSILWVFKLFSKVKYDSVSVFVEEVFALIDGRCVRWTARVFSVFSAAERAFHSYPLRNHNFLRVNPFEVAEPMLVEQSFQVFLIVHRVHLSSVECHDYDCAVQITLHAFGLRDSDREKRQPGF